MEYSILMTINEGVHCTAIGVFDGIGDYINLLRAADKPVSIQTVDSTVGLYDAYHSGEHPQDGLVFRRTKVEDVEVDRLPVEESTGLYSGVPEELAQYHFDIINRNLPRYTPEGNVELDFHTRVWTCSINEPSRNIGDIEYLAKYTLAIGKLMLAADVKYLAYGWSTGTPEPEFWEHPITLEYLRLCEANPSMLGVSIHEYSLDKNDISVGYPNLIGRVANLLRTCVEHNISYPYIHIGEFGWEERHIDVRGDEANRQLTWADTVYKDLGINPNRCLWTLGNWHNSTDEVVRDVIELLPLVTERCVNAVDEPTIPQPTIPKIVILKLPQEGGEEVWLRASSYAFNDYKRTITASSDDMLTMLSGGNTESYAIVVNPEEESQLEAVELLITNQFNFETMEL